MICRHYYFNIFNLKLPILKTKKSHPDVVNIVTLGCAKNLVDTENILTQLRANSIDAFHESNDANANVVVVNTCGFIDKAKEESVDTILRFAHLKNQGDIEKLYVTGCLSQRYKGDLEAEIPEVDAYFGTMELPALLERFNVDYQHDLLGERQHFTPPHYAYLKISEGCNRTCSFCAIPLMRGKHRSKTIEELVREGRHLASNGVKELVLIAQELTYYGLDIYKKRALSDLLYALSELEGIEWIRLHYAYPHKFPIEVVETMKKLPKVCDYLDLPLQHSSDPVLNAMRRNITHAETRQLISDIRTILPEITLRTTFLVGFPGETESDFNALCDFVREMEFDRVGVFQYSHEEGTSAYELVDDVPAEIKVARTNRLMEIQEEISFQKNQDKIGKTFKVLFDRKEQNHFIGRTESDSPEVDNEVLVDASEHFVRLGDFAQIKITDAQSFDLSGTPDQSTPDKA